MRKYTGASFIVLGIILSAFGIDSYIDRVFIGWSTDWPMLIGGILSVTIGLSLISRRRSSA